MENNKLIKYEGGLIKRVGNAISVTNKLLATIEPQLIPYRKGDKWGFCTADKKIIIDCVYDKAECFQEGVAKIKLKEEFGLINTNGKTILSCIYEHIGNPSEGLVAIKLNGKEGFVDKEGNEIIPCVYDLAFNFSNGLACVRSNHKYGSIDKTGKVIIPLIYDGFDIVRQELIKKRLNTENISNHFCGLTLMKNNEKYGFIDKNGNQTIPYIYDCIDERGCGFSEGLIDVEIEKKWGFINQNGKQIIPCIYDEVYPFFEELAGAAINDLWGFINKKGEVIVSFIYNEVFPFSNGIAMVENYKWQSGYINKKGIQYWD
jgi:hypothetical protein